MVLDDLRDSWTDMFVHIDDIVSTIVKKYPEFKNIINRDIIHKAVLQTQKLDTLLTDAKEVSEKNQRNLFNDNN